MSQNKIVPVSPILLTLPVAMVGSTQSLFVIALPIILILTDLRISQLSPILGLSALAFLIGGYTWPRRIVPGRRRQLLKRLLITATISQALFVATMFASAHEMIGVIMLMGMLFITRFTFGLTVSGIYPIVQTWLVSEHPAHLRFIVLTQMSAVISAGRVLVPLITAGLIIYRPEMVFALLIGLPLAAWTLLPPEYAQQANTLPASIVSRWPQAIIAIPTTLIHMSLGLTEFIIGPYLTAEWGTTLEDTLIYTALLLACIAACMMLAQFASIRFCLDPSMLMTWSPLGMALGATLITICPSVLPAGLILVSISLALLLPASAAGAAACGKPHAYAQAHASADLYTARILGHLLGVTFAGPLFESTSNLPLFIAAALALTSIPTSTGLRRALAVDKES